MRAAATASAIGLPTWRARLVLVVLAACLVVLAGRAVWLQGLNDDFLQQKGESRYSRSIALPPTRGMITDRHGEPLAISTPVESVWASPDDVMLEPGQLARLARLIGAESAELERRLADSRRDFVYLKRHLPPEQAAKVVALGIPGVFLQREYRRYYPSGLAVDHPYFQGPTTGLRNMSNTINTLLPYCDCLMTTRGAVRNNMAPEDVGSKPIMLRVTGGNSVLFEELSDEKITVTIQEAIRMDAAGVAVSVYIGSANQQQTILNLTDMINQAEEYGIPVLAAPVGKNMARDLRYSALASRICQDAGARIIKTYYCEEFSRLVDSVAPTPVVVAGGKYSSPPDSLQMVYHSLQAGAAGVDFGRNIFQDDNPVGMSKAIGSIVHENHTVKEALDIYSACLHGASRLD